MANPAPAIRLRALTLMDVLDESFRIYRANFPLLAGIAVLLAIPLLVIQLASGSVNALSAAYGTIVGGSGAPPPSDLTFGNPFVSLLQYPVSLALLPFIYGSLYAATVAIVLGTPVTIVSALRMVWRRYWALWALAFLYGLASVTLCLPPLGIWLLTKLSLMFPAIFTEQAPLSSAIDRSWRLTHGAFWRTFVLLFLSYLLVQTLASSLGGVFIAAAWLFPSLPVVVRVVLTVAVTQLVVQLAQPIFTIAVTLLYFDLRVRREAFDLEVMAYQLTPGQGGSS
jgi:hypothetical protein